MRIEQQDVLNASNGGLDILSQLFPGAAQCVNTNKKFKLRDHEKSASASIKKLPDGNYVVTDFGDPEGATPRNAIQWFSKENGISWVDALNTLAQQFGVTGSDVELKEAKATFSKRPATTEEKEKEWNTELKDSFTDFEIETLFSKNVLKFIGWKGGEVKKKEAYTRIKATCNKYNFYSLESYSLVHNREVLTFTSNEEYPIFLIDEGDFKKLYQPFHAEKGRRFMYIDGDKKPTNYVHGLKQAQAEFKKREDKMLAESDEDYNDEGDEEKKANKRKIEKLPEFILASGGSDALNLAVLGYWVGWMNSETAVLQAWDYIALAKVAEKVFQLQDIDDTGKKSAHRLAMEFLDLYTIDLPDALMEKKDRRFNPCKDLRDYFNHYEHRDFKKLYDIALPYRFWEKKPEYVGRGESRTMTGYTYEFDNVQAYNFLSKNGFYRLPFEGKKQEYIYVQIEGNIVRETKPNKVKNFIHNFLEQRMFEKDLRNKIYKSAQLNESSLSNLRETQINFVDFTDTSQFFFFNNGCVEVKEIGVSVHKPGVVNRFVWEQNVLDHHFKLEEPSFKIIKRGTDEYDIEILNQNCMFLQYLIQTSRVHWRKELEDNLKDLPEAEAEAYRKENHINIAGPNLTNEERSEQKMHLINKIFAFGYLMHRHKSESRAWAVAGLDNRMNEDGGSYGGSGKSIFLQKAAQRILKKTFAIAGTNPKITENPHIYGGLTEHHQYIYIDDMDKYMKIRFYFDLITGDITCNPKNADAYTLTFEQVAKFAFTTNFTLLDQSPSVQRRILYTAFSDYYHNKGESTEYSEDRSPKDDLGKDLFTQFNKDEWNSFYNTVIRCTEFFIQTHEKIGPPMDNVKKRNLQGVMGNNFEPWALVYFSEASGNLDKLIVKEDAFEAFTSKNKLGWSTQKFTAAIKAFCSYHNYILNPVELRNTKEGRIIHSVTHREFSRGEWRTSEKKQAKEFMYIQTDPEKALNGHVPGKDPEHEETEPMPF